MNVGRGPVVDEEALYRALADGRLGAAGLDVWYSYPATEAARSATFPSAYPFHELDNVVLSPRGGLVICEDSSQPVQRLYGMTGAGGLFEFCRSDVVLEGQGGFTGDFRGAEWAGACFSPDGRWLFANVYTPGFTVAITGPWRDGLI